MQLVGYGQARRKARLPTRRMGTILLSCAIALAFIAKAFVPGTMMAQTPIIVQPANQTAPAQAATAQKATDDSDVLAAIKSLEEMKAANEDMLKRQQVVLEALDQLQKEADQLRIFAKRG
jgi:acyl-CoA reductase-like NAD-dependent aldehyde dehydrogenase